MQYDKRSFLKATAFYLGDIGHWRDVALAGIGSYALAMFAWEARHPSTLAGFLLKNTLSLDERRALFLILLGSSVAGLLLWLIGGWGLARWRRKPLEAALELGARCLSALGLLPFLPILALEGLETLHPFLCFGLTAAMAPLTYWIVRSIGECLDRTLWLDWKPRLRLSKVGLPAVVILTLAYILVMSVVSVARHNGFATHAFDLGLQDQVVYNILHSGRMVTTLLGPTERFYDHFSPLFYLLAPIYALFQDARTLLVLQSVFLGMGAIPLYLLARDKTGSTALAVALAASYLLYPALHGVNLGDFHQIAFVSGLLLWALYWLERGRDRLFLVALLLALLAKEEMALSVAAIGIYVLLAKRRLRLGLALTAFGSLYLVVVTSWLMPLLGIVESAEWRYAGFILPGKGLQQSFILNFVTNPLYPIIYILSQPGKLVYLAQLLLPVLFLPMFAPIGAWIAALPAILLPLLTVPEADYGIRFHYSAHVTPFIFFLTVLALKRLGSKWLKPAALAASITVASIAMSYQYGQIISKQGILLPAFSEHTAVIKGFLTDIPREASVSTMSDLVPHLSARSKAYLFPVVADAEYLLLDSGLDANYWPRSGLKARSEAIRDMLEVVMSDQFGLVRQEDSVLLLKRGYSTAGNADAVRTLLSVRYEGEKLSGDIGAPVADPTASKGAARIATPASLHADGRTGLVYGPYIDLPPSKYRVEFALKTDRIDGAERVATIDVYSNKDGGVPRASRRISGLDFTAPDRYQTFSLELDLDRLLEDVEFRVQYEGKGTLWLDYIQVTPAETGVQ